MDRKKQLSNVAFGGDWSEGIAPREDMQRALSALELAVRLSHLHDPLTTDNLQCLRLLTDRVARGPMLMAAFERAARLPDARIRRDALDRALMDLAGHFRDALMVSSGAGSVTANHPDMEDRAAALAAHAGPDRLLRCIEAVLICRDALAANVKPKFAVDAMIATVGQALQSDRSR